MDSLRRVMALAAFETRLNMRMVRGWILGVLAALVGLVAAAYYLVLHRLFSGFSAPWAFITRDLWVFQAAISVGFLLGLVGIFLAFDWRHRDQSVHFAGTLDSSSLTRLEHAWGKFLGLCLVVTWPLAALFVAQVVGMAISGVWLPPTVFLVSFGVYAVPFALAPVAVAFGLAGLVRNQALARTLAIVLGIGWIALVFGAGFGMSEKFAVVAGTLTELPFYSDFVGYEAGFLTLLQRFSNFVQIAFFVSLAALGPLGLPRDARERGRRVSIVLGLALAWAACLGGIYAIYTAADSERHAILAAEETARTSRAPLVVLRRDLEVRLQPGRKLSGVAKLRVRPESGAWPSHALFRLNAGLEVTSVSVGGSAASFERDRTVLRVPLPVLGSAAETLIEIVYAGRPTVRSVDAGAALAEAEMSAQDRNNRRFLGNVPMFFDRASVVLGMDAAWYPDTALLLGARYPQIERPDLAPGSLVVSAPEGWRTASVGRRAEEGGRTSFQSDVPVPGFGLIAARYEEATADVDGLTVRLLYLPSHRRNVEFFAEAKDGLIARAKDRLAAIKSATGLSYPHPELSLVDVPQLVGVYASGWDTANRLGQPGVVMIREGQAFRARFEYALKSARDKWAKHGGGAANTGAKPDDTTPADATAEFDARSAKVEILERFAGTDFTGGDVERLVLRSMWDLRVKPAGEGAALVGVALPAFVAEAALGRYVADTPETARVIQTAASESVQLYVAGRTGEIGEVMMKAIAEPDAVWALMQETPLDRLDPAGKPAEFAGIMFVKGRQPFLAVRDTLGREAVSAVIGDLLAQAASGPLTWSAVRASVLSHADPAQAPDLERLFEAWLAGTELPGFVVERGRAFRLPGDTESWQAVATVLNRGTGAGTARLVIGEGDAAIRRLVSVPVGGSVEVALVSPTKPERWSLQPYLALNRTAPTGSLDILEAAEWDAPLDVTRDAPVAAKPELTVDNVDAGFKVLVDGESLGWQDRDDEGERRLDTIPVLWRAPGDWRRWTARSMSRYRPFGYFDESAAVKKATKDGALPASWTIALPQPGRWRVSAYLPAQKAGDGVKVSKELTFVVRHASGEQVVNLSLDAAKPGWNDLGPFEFDGSAEVRLLDKGDGLIIADAVRFTKE